MVTKENMFSDQSSLVKKKVPTSLKLPEKPLKFKKILNSKMIAWPTEE